MKHINTSKHRAFFKVLASKRGAQAAKMLLRPGQETGPNPENERPRSEQWLFVITGSGSATVAGRSVRLRANSLLLIEKDEAHRIVNSGSMPLVTLNLYAPPAYTRSGVLREE